MRFVLSVEYADGAKADAQVSTGDQVAFEDHWDRSIQRLFDDFRLKDVTWLAWHSLTRTGATSATYEDWLETVDSVTFGAADVVPLEETTRRTGK